MSKNDLFKYTPRCGVYKEIYNACEELSQMGENITVRKVRKFNGKGSHSTISKYIKIWRNAKREEYLKLITYGQIEVDEDEFYSFFNPNMQGIEGKLKEKKKDRKEDFAF